MSMNRNLKRVIDTLSYKYDFFYLIKTNKKKTALLLIIYLAFVSYVVYRIYDKDKSYGLISNVFPFFVDVAIVFLITVVFLMVRSLYNDEKGRINEKDNFIINKIVPLSVGFEDVKITYDKNNVYSQPRHLEILLNWVDFEKEDYFRTHYGSLDIPKIAIKKISFDAGSLAIDCSSTSFFDMSFTHYFPDYPLSSSGSTTEQKTTSLRSLLADDIESHYCNMDLSETSSFDFYDFLPNPMGITGIVELCIEGQEMLYILQARIGADAAAKDKIQHSFAGTIDLFPKMSEITSSLTKMVDTELFDEVIYQSLGDGLGLDILESEKRIQRENCLLGFAINPLYLYQPELFVKVKYTIPKSKEYSVLIKKINDEAEIFRECLKKKKSLPRRKSKLYVSSLEGMEKLLLNEHKIMTRNLFPVGLNLLKNNSVENSKSSS